MIRQTLCAALLFGLNLTATAEDAAIDENSARLEMARVLRADGQIEPAIAAYRKVLAASPGNLDAAGELAQTLAWNNELDAAREILRSIPAEKMTPAGLEAQADLDVQAGQFPEAIDALRRLIKQQPADSARQRLADVLSWQKQYDESIAIYADLVERHPDDIQLRRRYARILGWAGRAPESARQWKLSLDEKAQ